MDPRADQFVELERLGVATVNDALRRLSVHALLPYSFSVLPDTSTVIAGRVATALTAEGDNLAVYQLLEKVQPGEIAIVQSESDSGRSGMLGEVLLSIAKELSIRGFVLNGTIRDQTACAAVGLPVWYRGVNPRGSLKRIALGVNVAIAMGSVVVRPGAIAVCDADGVLVFDEAHLEAVLSIGMQSVESEQALKTQITEREARATLVRLLNAKIKPLSGNEDTSTAR